MFATNIFMAVEHNLPSKIVHVRGMFGCGMQPPFNFKMHQNARDCSIIICIWKIWFYFYSFVKVIYRSRKITFFIKFQTSIVISKSKFIWMFIIKFWINGECFFIIIERRVRITSHMEFSNCKGTRTEAGCKFTFVLFCLRFRSKVVSAFLVKSLW